jgi:hypothetical protein
LGSIHAVAVAVEVEVEVVDMVAGKLVGMFVAECTLTVEAVVLVAE